MHINFKSKPNLNDIQEHIFEVAERVKTTSNPKFSKIESTSLAANVFTKKPDSNLKFKPCVLCDPIEAKHPMFKCDKFDNPIAKVNRLRELKLCVKCGGPNHFANECKYSFKKSCYNCNKNNHFSFLCLSSKKGDGAKNKNKNNTGSNNDNTEYSNNNNSKSITKDKDHINSGTCQIEITASEINVSQNILPTFSCKLKNDTRLRVLMDSGAQISFVTYKIANKYKFEILKRDVNVTIKGFNSRREEKTNIVEVPVFVKDRLIKICAVVIPDIKTDIRIERLYEIAQKLAKKDYTLADEFILELKSDRIANLDMVMGTNALHSLPGTIVSFGKSQSSCMYETQLGVLLMGDSAELESNIDYLPMRNETFKNSLYSEHVKEPHSAEYNILAVEKTDKLIGADCRQLDMAKTPAELSHTPVNKSDVMCTPADSSHMKAEKFEAAYSPESSSNTRTDPDVSKIESHIDVDFQGDIDYEHNFFSNFIGLNIIDDFLDELESPIRDSIMKDNIGILDRKCSQLLQFEDCNEDPVTSNLNKKIVDSTLASIKRDNDGRLQVPIIWHQTNSKLLAKNFELCKKILYNVTSKLKKDLTKFKMVDEVINDQIKMDIIKPIDDLHKFLRENPDASFMPFMPIFKLEKSTSKCRLVYLSNICEKSYSDLNLTHNQTMLPGPPLNNKLMTSIIQLRFNEKVCIFDLCKAFHMLKLGHEDQTKLCFLWYRDATGGDFSLKGYMCNRLPYGLRCSPYLLMIALYYILIYTVDTDDESANLKRDIYNLFYMDNGAISANSSDELIEAYHELPKIFSPFGFELQQFATNDPKLKTQMVKTTDDPDDHVKLLGMYWDTSNDTLSANKIALDAEANTKRKILSSIASNFDIFQMNGPLLNRARLFMHGLQCHPKIGWDTKLDANTCKIWKNISRQVNDTPIISIPRLVGKSDSEYRLVGCVDASKDLYGVVVYLLEVESGKLSFLSAKNRIITKNLCNKSIPSLELLAINLGVECLMDVHNELAGPTCISPINISQLHILSDSQVCLSWLQSYSDRFSKLNKLSTFVQNRLNSISNLCKTHNVTFTHIAGKENPADCITRPLSYKLLMKSNYLTGPDTSIFSDYNDLSLTIPNPQISNNRKNCSQFMTAQYEANGHEPLVNHSNISSYSKLLKIHKYVLTFIDKIKVKLENKKGNNVAINENEIYKNAQLLILKDDQKKHFPNLISYFNSNDSKLKNVPQLISDLNVFRDRDLVLRVKSKFSSIGKSDKQFPILLSKDSHLTKLIVEKIHKKLNHSGKYAVLSEFRKEFYLSSCFSYVKKCIKACITCNRFNNRTIKLNQNSYRDIRVNPSKVPFRNLFMDYIGPFDVTLLGERRKVYLLLFTCLFTRAINLKLCLDLSVDNFVRAFQLHVFDHGFPSVCLSDLGSQLVAGTDRIAECIKDPYTQRYLSENNIHSTAFDQYPKGCEKLGGLVETCVKMVKRLIYGSIRKNVTSYSDFEYLICEVNHLVNRRPVSFIEALRDCSTDEQIPTPITPEMLVKGHELVSINIMPHLTSCQTDPDYEPSKPRNIASAYTKLADMRKKLINIYVTEFIPNLIDQATDIKGRYKKVKHDQLKVGDLVLLKETFCKPANFPLGMVKSITKNDLDEVTSVNVLKGKTKETVLRHVTSIVPLLSVEKNMHNEGKQCTNVAKEQNNKIDRCSKRRNAAIQGDKLIRSLASANLI